MDNPFRKRATEYQKDDEAFIAMVSPEPVKHFVLDHGKSGALYDRLTVIQGTPGSGKTTLARLFEFPTVMALIRNRSLESHKFLVSVLAECGVLENLRPKILGCRIPLEADFRDIWELPYSDEQKNTLFVSLLQARALLGWLRYLQRSGIEVSQIKVDFKDERAETVQTIGGPSILGLLDHARKVEIAIYRVLGSLVPPSIERISNEVHLTYRPFDFIEGIRTASPLERDIELQLQPLVILDDAHLLHKAQFAILESAFVRRELKVARWVMTRLDAFSPQDVLSAVTAESASVVEVPGITASRDVTRICLNGEQRKDRKTQFRSMAKDMAFRYLKQMAMFNQKDLNRIESFLEDSPQCLTDAQLRELGGMIDSTCERLHISKRHLNSLREEVESFFTVKRLTEPDVKIAMLSIALHRHANRLPQGSLFDDLESMDPKRPVTVDVGVYDGARIQLYHAYSRAFFFGINDLCDASNNNAEQFLRLSAEIVDAVANRIQRRKAPTLPVAEQNRIMKETADDILRAWDFPESKRVKALIEMIAKRCLKKTLEPNAPLDHGASAYGILQSEFEKLSSGHAGFSNVLKYGVAYNAINLVTNYECKKKQWCLVELGGIALLHYGLTLKRGGFVEGSIKELESAVLK